MTEISHRSRYKKPVNEIIPNNPSVSAIRDCYPETATSPRPPAIKGQIQPTERLITDNQGRQLDGTILERSGRVIRFERTSDKKQFNLPLGAQELSEQAFRSRIADILILKPMDSRQTGHKLDREVGGETHLHQIYNANSREENLDEFLEHAAEPRIAVELRKGHQVFVPDTTGFVEITGEPTKANWPVNIPGTKTKTIPEKDVLKLLETSQGVFFSVRQKPDITQLP